MDPLQLVTHLVHEAGGIFVENALRLPIVELQREREVVGSTVETLFGR